MGWILAGVICISVFLFIAKNDASSADSSYISVLARNLAEGVGSFWYPAFSLDPLETYHQHPPLGIGLNSVFFRIFGDSIFTERIFSIVLLFLNVIILIGIWLVAGERPNSAWMPILLWISIPSVAETAMQNPLMQSSGLFASGACLFYLLAFRKRKLAILIPATVLLAAAFFTWGYPMFFILLFPFWLFLFSDRKSFRFMIAYMVLPILIFAGTLILVFLMQSSAMDSILNKYLTIVALDRLYEEPNVVSRMWILFEVLQQTIPLWLISMFLIVAGWRKGVHLSSILGRALPFILTGLSFVGPITLQWHQNIIESFPVFFFLALGLAFFCKSVVESAIFLTRRKAFSLVSLAAFLILVFWFINLQPVDQEAINQKNFALKIKANVGVNLSMGAPKEICEDKGLRAQLSRWARVKLSESDSSVTYFVSRDTVPEGFSQLFYSNRWNLSNRHGGIKN